MSELERSTVVLQALDTLSGFNSALAIQVNSTRQDVRITKEKLREEERQNREAQQSLEHWSREVESERQLLFEAMAYLNDDVRSPMPNIEKIQSDIKRLKDFIAYKVTHSDEERDQYRLPGSGQNHGLSSKKTKKFADELSNNDAVSFPLLLNDKEGTQEDRRDRTTTINVNGPEIDRIKSEAVRHKEEALAAREQAQESRIMLDRSEAEAASFIGRIVAEKESLSVDRDMLILQLTNASAESSLLKESIATLKLQVIDANAAVKRAGKDVQLEHNIALDREKTLKDEGEEQRHINALAVEDLKKMGDELLESLKANGSLGTHVQTLESVLLKERSAREKERSALTTALNNIDDLNGTIKQLKAKDNEREMALDKISTIEREAEASRYETFLLHEEMMVVRGELERSNVEKMELLERIDILEAEKVEYETGKELVHLTSQLNEYKDMIVNAEKVAEETATVSAVRLSSCQKEIERLALDLIGAQKEGRSKDAAYAMLQCEMQNLKDKISKEEEERREASGVKMIVAQSAEVKLTIAELVLALQANRLLADEVSSCKLRVLEEQEARAVVEEQAMHAIDLKSQEVEAVIESSKATLYKAASQVEDMKAQLEAVEVLREEAEGRYQGSEERCETLRNALHSAMLELERSAEAQDALQREIARMVKEKAREADRIVQQAAMAAARAASADAAAAEEERLTSLRAELARMIQLKEVAETQAAALALLSGGSRVYDAVHALTVRTNDYAERVEEEPYALPMDFAQYKRMAASQSISTHPPPHTHTLGVSPRPETVPGPYFYPPHGQGRVYTLDDFQGSDDSYAANIAAQKYGQKSAKFLGTNTNKNTINGSSRHYDLSTHDSRPQLPAPASPRSRNDRHNYLNSDMTTSSDHGLSFSLSSGMPSKQGHKGDGQRGVHKDRGRTLHSPSPSRVLAEQALAMSDNESDSDLTGARYVGSDSGGDNKRNDGSRSRSRSNSKERDEAKERERERELAVVKSRASPVSDRSLSPHSKALKEKAKSPWIATFKANNNWNYSPPIPRYLPEEDLPDGPIEDPMDSHPLGSGSLGSGSLLRGEVAGKYSKEFRSVDEYFMQ